MYFGYDHNTKYVQLTYLKAFNFNKLFQPINDKEIAVFVVIPNISSYQETIVRKRFCEIYVKHNQIIDKTQLRLGLTVWRAFKGKSS